MVWRHSEQGDPPPLELLRIEECDGFAIVFFAGPDAGERPLNRAVLWAAGSTSESPEGADGGWAQSHQDPTLERYREARGPCSVTFER